MGSKHFRKLIEQQIDIFVSTFSQGSNSLFKNEQNKLIHPGEYGMYKEACFRNLLQSILDKDYSVSEGFIITACDNISTQCDVIVNRSSSRPLTGDGIGKFYPVEDVFAIGEIKSNLSRTDLKSALCKLAKVKMLGSDRKGNRTTSCFKNQDNIPTFLVCNKLNFDIKTINFDDIYDGIERRYWHNAILCLEDGVILYQLDLSKLPPNTKAQYEAKGLNTISGKCEWQYSQHIFQINEMVESYDCPTRIIIADKSNKYVHIILFLTGLVEAIEESIKYTFDSIEYLGMRSNSL